MFEPPYCSSLSSLRPVVNSSKLKSELPLGSGLGISDQPTTWFIQDECLDGTKEAKVNTFTDHDQVESNWKTLPSA